MDRETIIEKTSSGTFLSLNYRGEKVLLVRNARMSFDNVAGSQVEVFTEDARVTCRAKVPETCSDLQWVFSLDQEEGSSSRKGRSSQVNLESLILRARVSLNGKL